MAKKKIFKLPWIAGTPAGLIILGLILTGCDSGPGWMPEYAVGDSGPGGCTSRKTR
jgi:hypothetical protein